MIMKKKSNLFKLIDVFFCHVIAPVNFMCHLWILVLVLVLINVNFHEATASADLNLKSSVAINESKKRIGFVRSLMQKVEFSRFSSTEKTEFSEINIKSESELKSCLKSSNSLNKKNYRILRVSFEDSYKINNNKKATGNHKIIVNAFPSARDNQDDKISPKARFKEVQNEIALASAILGGIKDKSSKFTAYKLSPIRTSSNSKYFEESFN